MWLSRKFVSFAFVAMLACCLAGTNALAQVDVSGSNGVDGSYATLGSAFTAINGADQTGMTVVVDLSGDTVEAATAVLNAGLWTSLTIKPVGGAARTISGAPVAGTALIELNGADNVTIDGLNSGGNSLIITNTLVSATSNTSTIRLINGATNNLITRASVLGSFSGSAPTNGGNIFFHTDSGATGNDNNTISYCELGPAGTDLPTKVIHSSGSANLNNNNIIDNNNIFDFFSATVSSAGIYLGGNTSAWIISNNRFFQTAPRTQSTGNQHSPIWITNTTNGLDFIITENTIGFASSAGTGVYTFIGTGTGSKLIPMYINTQSSSTNPTSIQGNLIAGIEMSGSTNGTSTSGPLRGIYIANGFANIGNVTGNTIGSMSAPGSITYTSNSSSTSDIYAIYNYSMSNTTISNNNIGGIQVANSSTGASCFYGIRINTGSTYTFTAQNNVIGGTVPNSILSTSTAIATTVQGIYNQSSPATITNNVIRNMTAGGGTGTGSAGSVIGITLTSSSVNHTVSQNRIFSLGNSSATAATWITGIQFNSSTGTNLISRNLIYGLIPSSDTAVVNGINIAGGTATYQNNMIAVGETITSISPIISGIAELIGGVNNIYHNSVYIGGNGVTSGAGNSYAFQSTLTTNVRNYRNNIFVNARTNSGATGTHYAIRVGGTTPNPAGLTSNNNVLRATGTGSMIGYFNSANQATLPLWQAATGQDYNSFTSAPRYIAAAAFPPDLHIHPTNPTVIEGAGFNVSVVDDFDGEARASLTPVDIGADAGNFVPSDQASPSISYTPFANTALLTNRTLNTTITDATGVAIAPNQPRIYYNKNITLPPAPTDFPYSQACVSTGVDTWNCQIVVSDMGGVVGGDVISYYVIAQDTAGPPANVGSNPGGVVATSVHAITSHPPVPNQYTIIPGMSGSIYIGTANDASCPSLNFPTITAAVTALNGSQLTGGTTFYLCDADYSTSETFPITINQNPGSSPTTRLTIKPYTGLTSVVSGSSAAAIIKLNGADFTTIDGSNTAGGTTRDLTIVNNNTGGAAIWVGSTGIGAGATYNVVRHTILQAGSLTATNYGLFAGDATTLGNAGADNDNLTLRNLLVQRAFYGVSVRGTATGVADNLIIAGNTVGGEAPADYIGRFGVVVEQAASAQIVDNTIRNVVTATSNPFGLQLNAGVVNSTVVGNTITNVRYTGTGGYGGKGLELNTGIATSNLLIANNVITEIRGDGWSNITSDAICGIRLLGTTGGVRLYYNSVYLGYGTYAGYNGLTVSAALGIAGTVTGLDIQNNALATNLVNSANAGARTYAIYSQTPATAFSVIDFNDYYATGSQGVLGFLTATAYTTLGDWQTATGQDTLSIIDDPSFNSVTNLQPNPGSALIGAGTYIAEVLEDILGVVRDGSNPTIGAYEEAADTAGPTIVYTLLPNTISTVSPVAFSGVGITDISGVNGTAGTRPRVYYKRLTDANAWNDNTSGTDGWKWVEASGAATPFDFNIDYNLLFGGTGVSTGDTIQYFVVAQDMAPTPNVGINSGTFTAQPASVVLTAAAFPIGTPINSYMILPTMSGVMYVGTVNDASCPQLDYATITAAVSALNGSVLTGATTFYLCDADYSASETFPLVINANSGSSVANTVLFKPYTGLTSVVSGSSATSLIKLNGIDYLTIDGSNAAAGTTRDLTLANTNAAGVVVWIASASASDGATNNAVQNANISGSLGAATSIAGIIAGSGTTLGNPADSPNSYNMIANNRITAVQNAVYISGNGTGLDQDWLIADNVFGSSDAASQLRYRGMLIMNAQNFEISGNTISGVISLSSSSATMTGIQIAGLINGGEILANEIFDIKQTNTAGWGCNGMYFGSSSTAANILIANNVIYDVAAYGFNGTGSVDNGWGIFVYGGGGYRFYYNSVRMTTNQTAATSVTAAINVASTFTTAGGLDIQNNAFANTQTVGTRYAVYSGATNAVYATIDYNDYFKGTGTNLGYLGATQLDIAAWRIATGQDVNSIEDDPLFNSTTNLQPAGGSPLIGAGVYIAEVLDDFLSIIRDTTNPTIGAYEQAGDSAGPAITYTALGNTLDATGPRTLDNVTITDDSGVNITTGTAPRVYYKRSTDANEWNDNTNTTDGWKWAEANGTTSPFDFSIDYTLLNGGTGVTGGQTIQYFVVAQDLVSTPNVSINAGTFAAQPVSVALTGAAFPIGGTINAYTIVNYLFDFEAADDEDFTHTTTVADDWERGMPNGGIGGPVAAFSGANCWGTDLTGNYENSAIYILYSPVFKATGTSVLWSFMEHYNTESGYDWMYPEYSINSGAWTLAPAVRYAGSQTFWAMKTFNISLAANDTIQLRFRLTTDSSSNDFAGWYVDDMAIAGAVLVDLLPPTIDYTPLTNTISAASPRNLADVTITDSAGVNTTSGTAPRVYYKRSTDADVWNDNTNTTDGWKWAEANGTTSPFDFDIDYTLLNGGTGVAAGTVVQYFVVAEDLATVPNVGINSGTFAATPASVALTGAAFPIGGTINSYTISTPLTGTYDVPGGAYGSLTNAGGIFEALNNGVITGNVVIEISADLINESGLVALEVLSEEPPASGFTVTIKPTGAARSITGTGVDTDLIVIYGADRVTIDGSLTGGTDRSLTINNPNTLNNTTAIGIYSQGLGAGSTDITIKNCIVETGDIGDYNTDTTYGIVVFDADNDNVTIQNNVIHKTTLGLYAGGASGGLLDNLTIVDNSIGDTVVADSIGYQGMYIDYTDGAIISGNTINNVTCLDYVALGLYMGNSTNAMVTDNTITNVSGVYTNPRGMLFGTVVNSSVLRNTVIGVHYIDVQGYGGRGIEVSTGNASSNLLIANNIVADITGDGWSSIAWGTNGLMLRGTTGGVNVYHNSVFLGSGDYLGSAATNCISAAFAVEASVTAIDVRNNIFATNLYDPLNAGSKTYAIYSAAANTAYTAIDYNDYFVDSTQGVLGYLSADQATLLAWQTATGQDVNSYEVDPAFVSTTDLHIDITLNPPLVGMAVPITGITDDVDGEVRHATMPDIGADEIWWAAVGDGFGSEIPLTIVTNGTDIDLSWGDACGMNAGDYVIYEGSIAALSTTGYNHEDYSGCTTSGNTFSIGYTPQAGDRYFLIVPVIGDAISGIEGSYGLDSAGVERDQAGTPCRPFQNAKNCP